MGGDGKTQNTTATVLTRAPAVPRTAEGIVLETKSVQWQHCERLAHVNIAELNDESLGSLEIGGNDPSLAEWL